MMETFLVSTSKGLVHYSAGEGKTPTIQKLFFRGFNVTMAYIDPRNGAWWVGITHKHWGQKLHYSLDKGKNWEEAALPHYDGRTLPDGKTAKLLQIWCMHHGGFNNPNKIWLGTDPGGLFVSNDYGKSFQLVEGLWNHESRQKVGQWFGAGSDFPFIHSIIVNPQDENHIYIAVSCAGVFESKDGGETWEPKNEGLVATYLPNPKVKVGHDPHLVLMAPQNAKVLWQQNHCGVFFSDNGGENWNDVSVKCGIPYYGFAIAIGDNPSTAWVIPVQSDEERVAPDLKLQVYQTTDLGENWVSVSNGLPDELAFDIVLRQAFVASKKYLMFGTTNGNLYFSEKNNIHWKSLHHNLTKVNSVVYA